MHVEEIQEWLRAHLFDQVPIAISIIDRNYNIVDATPFDRDPIAELAESSSFVETSYLLIYGELPTPPQMAEFSNLLTYHSMLHEDMRHFFDGFPSRAHPMAILSAMINAIRP
mgnify:CR=1 FL=1